MLIQSALNPELLHACVNCVTVDRGSSQRQAISAAMHIYLFSYKISLPLLSKEIGCQCPTQYHGATSCVCACVVQSVGTPSGVRLLYMSIAAPLSNHGLPAGLMSG